jgi:amidase
MSMNPHDLCYLGLVEVGELIRVREVSSVEVTQTCLARIESLDTRLHSYATMTPELALRAAGQADREIESGTHRGAMHGVPLAVKDLFDVEGVPTLAGMPLRRGHVAAEDSTVVRRLKEAGAIILGKLQMTEGALSLHHPDIEAPVNPWSAEHWAGVSSSGSGVATAAGLCFGSLGSDTLGSIRFPATMNGVTGLKPTWGRVSRAGVVPLAQTMDHVGPMARHVRDVAAILQVIAGPDPADPTASAEPVPDYQSAFGSAVEGVRIGIDRSLIEAGAEAEMAGMVRDVEGTMSGLGALAVETTLPELDQIVQDSMMLCSIEAARAHAETFPARRSEYGEALAKVLDQGLSVQGAEVAAIWQRRLAFRAELSAVFDDVDLILLPAMNLAAPTIEYMSALLYEPAARTARLRFTSPYTMSGHPCLTMPGGATQDGLPLGFQFVGPHFGESALLAAGHAFQQVTDWHLRRPV